MDYDLALIGGDIVTSVGVHRADVGVRDGKIAAISDDLAQDSGKQLLDLSQQIILPGCIDSHMHLWEPGFDAAPDFRAGTIAAVAGGVTTIIDHPLTIPEVLTPEVFRNKVKLGEESSYTDFALHGGVNSGNSDQLQGLWESGCTALKIFMCESGSEVSMLTDDELLEAFRRIAAFGGTAIVHAEDNAVLEGNRQRLLEQGRIDPMAFVEWRTPDAEFAALQKAVRFAEMTGIRLGVLHTTVPEGVEFIADARKRGVDVWVETTPHNLYLSHEELQDRGPWVTFAPPMRDRKRAADLWEQLSQGAIHLMGSDHCAVEKERKEAGESDIWKGLFGIPGAETMVPLMLHAVVQGEVALPTLVKMLAEAPARMYGLYPRKGTIQVGADADFTIVNLMDTHTIHAESMYTSCGWSPYEGWKLQGRVTHSILRGEVVMAHGEVIGDAGFGQFICRA